MPGEKENAGNLCEKEIAKWEILQEDQEGNQLFPSGNGSRDGGGFPSQGSPILLPSPYKTKIIQENIAEVK